ncbi:lipoprotein insertase outer membrane protein LolB [Halomonas sp. DP8Y7-1]|uniref:lipoprotein insertase outer membrane protein LolB n=1 Tax=Halomonas sp. DP8Y7-1 TaxID=2859078 RepID=UPI0021BD39A0|nr:lipoprotein insertase outer membrane protein LolB [Halomonas sp. DP8Y7-1]
MMPSLRLPAIALGLSLLAGCATSQSVTEPRTEREAGDWEAQLSQVEAFTAWNLTGKVGLRTPEDSTSANLDWRQTPYHYRLLVTGPMGAGRSTLEGRDGRVSLTTSEGRFEADSPEALMEQRLGWSLPVSSLTDWVRGLPADNSDHRMTEDELGFPATLEQDGWEIDYRGWEDVSGTWLPRRLVMTYDDLRATLVVNQWQPLEE